MGMLNGSQFQFTLQSPSTGTTMSGIQMFNNGAGMYLGATNSGFIFRNIDTEVQFADINVNGITAKGGRYVRSSATDTNVYSELSSGGIYLKDASGNVFYDVSDVNGRTLLFQNGSAPTKSARISDYLGSLNFYVSESSTVRNGTTWFNNATDGIVHYAPQHRFWSTDQLTYFATIDANGINCQSGNLQKGGYAINIEATAKPSNAPNHPGQIHNDKTNKRTWIGDAVSAVTDFREIKNRIDRYDTKTYSAGETSYTCTEID